MFYSTRSLTALPSSGVYGIFCWEGTCQRRHNAINQ